MDRIRFGFPFLAVWMILCVLLFVLIYDSAKNKAIDELNARQALHAQQAAKGIESFFSRWVSLLTSLSKKENIRRFDENGKKTMQDVLDFNRDEITAITRVDAKGAILYTIPYVANVIGQDISHQQHIKKLLRTHQPVLSDVFRTVQGYDAVVLHIPVFLKGQFAGSIGALVDFKIISKRYLDDIRIGETGYAWMLSSKGIELFCPVPGHAGRSVFENCRDFPSVIKMAEKMLDGKQGETVYVYDRIGGNRAQTIKKHAVYRPLPLVDNFWSIAVASSEEEIFLGLKNFKNKLIIVICMILSGTIAATFLGLKALNVLREDEKRRKAEDALRESEEKYRSVMEAAREPMVVYDTRGRASYINPAFTRVFGWTQEEVLGKRIDFVPEEEKDVTFEKLDVLAKEGKVGGFKTRRLTKDGRVVDVSISASSYKDNEGRHMGMVANLNDISYLKKTEERLRKSESFLEGFFRAAPVGLGMCKDRIFLMVNEQLSEITGYSVEELTGMEARALYLNQEDYLKTGEDHYGRVAERGFASSEARWKRKDGREIDVLMNTAPVSRDSEPTEVLFAVSDITEKKEREKLYHLLFESANDAIFLMQDSVFIDCNTKALEMYGVKRGEIIGKNPLDFTEPRLPDGRESALVAAEKIRRALKGRPQAFEWRHVRPDGTGFDTEVSLSRVDLRGKSLVQAIVRDITERKRAEDALEKRILALTRPMDDAGEIIFEELFNPEDIQRLQDEFARATGVASLITRPDGTPITEPSNFCRLCKDIIRKTEIGLKNCYHSDSVIGRYNPKGPNIQPCLSGGLRDAGASITVGGKHIANWLIGQVRDGTQTDEKMRAYARTIGVDEEEFLRAFHEVPTMSREQFSHVARALFTLASQLSATAYQNVQQARFISERKGAEEALRKSEERYREIVEGTDNLVTEVDKKGRFTFVNEAAARVFGLDPEKCPGRLAFDFIHEEDREKTLQNFGRWMEEKPSGAVFENRQKSITGQVRDMLWTINFVYDEDGEVASIKSIARDITERKKAEQALKKSEDYLASIFRTVPTGIVILREGRVFTTVNERITEITGYSKEELIDRTTRILYHNEEEYEDAGNKIYPNLLSRDIVANEFRMRHKSGREIHVLTTSAPLRHSDKSRMTVHCILDITERKKAERELAAEKRFSEALLESLPGIFYMFDENRELIRWNRSFETLSGFERDELYGKQALDWFDDEDKKSVADAFQQVFALKDVRIQAGLVVRSRKKIPFDFVGSPFQRGGKTFLIGVGLNIAESVNIRKKLEQYREQLEELVEQRTKELRESEAFAKSMVESSPDCIKVLNDKGRLTYMSPGGKALLEVDNVEQFMGVHYLDFWQDTPYIHMMSQTLAAALSGNPGKAEAFLPTAKGTPRWWNISFTPITSRKDGANDLLIVSRDITAIKEAQQQSLAAKEAAEAANQAKSEFLANMSHEIRTPMNAVVGMSELMLTTKLTDRQKDYAQSISDAGIALLAILDDILDLSKIQAGKLSLENVTFDLRAVVEQVGQILAMRAREKKMEVLVRYPPDLPSRFVGDPTRIRQVLMNLAGNAVKFTDTGHVLLEVSMEGKDRDQCGLVFSVSDTGIGISAEQLETIFEQFSQGDESTTRRYGGTGLGLTISKKLVEMMGGAIRAESEPGRGSVFSFNLILPCSDESGPEIPLDMDLAHARVLVVDDNERNREIALEYLRLGSISCEAVDSAEKALAALREAGRKGSGFDMAILDYHMPRMKGPELAGIIKRDPELSSTLLVLLSSFMPSDELDLKTRALFAASLNKPIKVSLFYETLARVWRLKNSPQSNGVLPPETPGGAEKPMQMKASALLVEDSPMNQKVASEVLKRFGLTVDTASNGREAVEMFGSGKYDIVFMDVHMPVMDGFEATKTIRNMENGKSRVSIVAMTALAMSGDRDRCIEAGMDDYIAKPIRSKAVWQALVRALGPGEAGMEVREEDAGEHREKAVVLNPKNLLDLGGDDPDIIHALIDEYMKDAPRYLEELKLAVKSEEPGLIREKSHRLHGLVANAGGERARKLLMDIEEKSGRGRYIPDIMDMSPLMEEMNRLQQALKETDWDSLCGQPGTDVGK